MAERELRPFRLGSSLRPSGKRRITSLFFAGESRTATLKIRVLRRVVQAPVQALETISMLPFLPSEIDPIVNAPVRLAILSLLAIHGSLDFSTIKQRLAVTDGALGMHLQKLVSSGYAKCQKAFFDGKPRSTYFLSQAGRVALGKYVEVMGDITGQLRTCESLVNSPRKAA